MLRPNLRSVFGLSILVFLYANGSSSKLSQNEVSKFFNLQEPRIINGTVATMEATRHQVSLRKKRNDGFYFGSGHLCGGSLISENVVLSAAHCIVNYDTKEPDGTFHPDSYFIVAMGNLNRFNNNNNTLVFNIVKIIKRVEIFNLNLFLHDIILLILDGKVPAQHPTVRPIILNDRPLANNTLCQVTGWGKTEEGYESEVLLTVYVPIIDADDCRRKTVYEELVAEGMICAGYLEGEKDSCTGDSGGPLVCDGVQAGIISWGSGCAQPLSPGICTDIAFHKDWILQEVAKHNVTLPKFTSDAVSLGGDDDGVGDGVAHLTCSLIFIILMSFLNVCLGKTK